MAKRIISIALTLVMVFALTACGTAGGAAAPSTDVLKAAMENTYDRHNFSYVRVEDDYYAYVSVAHVQDNIQGLEPSMYDPWELDYREYLEDSYKSYYPDGNGGYFFYEDSYDEMFKMTGSKKNLTPADVIDGFDDIKESVSGLLLENVAKFKYVNGYWMSEGFTVHYDLSWMSEAYKEYMEENYPEYMEMDGTEIPIRNIAITLQDDYIHEIHFEYLEPYGAFEGYDDDALYVPVMISFYDFGEVRLVLPEASAFESFENGEY